MKSIFTLVGSILVGCTINLGNDGNDMSADVGVPEESPMVHDATIESDGPCQWDAGSGDCVWLDEWDEILKAGGPNDGGAVSYEDGGNAEPTLDANAPDSGIDAGGPPDCMSGIDEDENLIDDGCEGCPLGGCFPVIWSHVISSGPPTTDTLTMQTRMHIDATPSELELIQVVMFDEKWRSTVFRDEAALSAIGGEKQHVSIHFTGSEPYDYDFAAKAFPEGAVPAYVKCTVRADYFDPTKERWGFLGRWQIHGTPAP